MAGLFLFAMKNPLIGIVLITIPQGICRLDSGC